MRRLSQQYLVLLGPTIVLALISDSLAEEWNSAELLKWKAPIGVKATPVTISSDLLFIGTSTVGCKPAERLSRGGLMLCIRLDDGALVWMNHHPGLAHSHDYPTNGVRSNPKVDDRRLYYISNRGEVVCLNIRRKDGRDMRATVQKNKAMGTADVAWTFDMVSKLGVSKMDGYGGGNPVCTPLVFRDWVFAVTGNGCSFHARSNRLKEFIPSPNAPSFVALDKRTGKLHWTAKVPPQDLMFSWSSPSLARVNGQFHVVFPGGDGRLYGFVPNTGKLIWRLDCNDRDATRWSGRRRGTRNFFFARPTIIGDTLFVGLNQDLEGYPLKAPLLAVDLSRASRRQDDPIAWTFSPKGFDHTYGRAAVSKGILFAYCQSTGVLFAVDAASGRELWRAEDLGLGPPGFCSPYVHNGKVYVATSSSIETFDVARVKRKVGSIIVDGSGVVADPRIHDNVMYLPTKRVLLAFHLPSDLR